MKKMLIALAAMSMTCACTTVTAPSVSAVDRAQAAYDRIAATADIVLPFLPPERAARVRLAMALAERGLLAARTSATAAEKLAALKQAESATAAIESTTVAQHPET